MEPVDEDRCPVVAAPDERALLVVEPPLQDGRPGQLGEVARGADVVGVEVRDDDPRDAALNAGELGRPPLARVGKAEARCRRASSRRRRAAGTRGRAPAASAAGA